MQQRRGNAIEIQGSVPEEARTEAGLHVPIREGGRVRAEGPAGGERGDRRKRNRLSALRRHQRCGGDAERTRRSGHSKRRIDVLRGRRKGSQRIGRKSTCFFCRNFF